MRKTIISLLLAMALLGGAAALVSCDSPFGSSDKDAPVSSDASAEDKSVSAADLTDDYAAIPAEMKEVAAFYGKPFLRGLTAEQLTADIGELRKRLDIQMTIASLASPFDCLVEQL